MEKERLDILLVNRGMFESREKARNAIMSGVVFINGNKEDKAGTKFAIDCEIFIKENLNPYVSRGGLKLEKALKAFEIDMNGKTAIDIGASTGGFTDCMLKKGASRVVAVDVGYGQLSWQLRNDERVICMERTNIRHVKPEDIGFKANFASVDVSFISLSKVLPPAKELLSDRGEVVCLIKPQFEAGREKVGKHGVVRDPEVHTDVIKKIITFVNSIGFSVKGLTYSPIKGPEGNIEYLIYLLNAQEDDEKDWLIEAEKVVSESHGSLDV